MTAEATSSSGFRLERGCEGASDAMATMLAPHDHRVQTEHRSAMCMPTPNVPRRGASERSLYHFVDLPRSPKSRRRATCDGTYTVRGHSSRTATTQRDGRIQVCGVSSDLSLIHISEPTRH